ncbi:hypothetical protein NDU88_006399, partial [Pleurodeles waltl]
REGTFCEAPGDKQGEYRTRLTTRSRAYFDFITKSTSFLISFSTGGLRRART